MSVSELDSGDLGPTTAPKEKPPVPFYKNWIFGADPRKTLLRLLVLNLVAFAIFRVLLMPITVVGTSMRPTYESGEMLFVNRWPYSSRLPHRGDVVAVRLPSGVLYLKRIMGLPGERISIRHGWLNVNGRPLEDPYAFSRVRIRVPTIQLESDEYFVIGDNRAVTVLGAIKGSQIVGKVVF